MQSAAFIGFVSKVSYHGRKSDVIVKAALLIEGRVGVSGGIVKTFLCRLPPSSCRMGKLSLRSNRKLKKLVDASNKEYDEVL